MEEANTEALSIDEINDEIGSALKDPRGLSSHQKRLGFCLSFGITELLEEYLIKKNALKPGHKINHQWLKKKRENFLKILSDRLVTPIENLEKLNKILDIAYEIENKRNALIYGKDIGDRVLQGLINNFLEIKKEIEND